MLIKLNPIFPAFARQSEKTIDKALTRQQWIYADRVIILLMFLTVITGAIILS